MYKNEYLSVQQKYVNHYEIFTDGSKQGAKVAAAPYWLFKIETSKVKMSNVCLT